MHSFPRLAVFGLNVVTAFAGFFYALLLVCPVRAQEDSTSLIRVGFRFDAGPSCMSEEEAFSLVHRRSRRVVRVPSDEASQTLQMSLQPSQGGYRGTLSVHRKSQAPEQRSMTGESCDEVIEALALTAALSIDPHATLTLGSATTQNRSTRSPRHEKKPGPAPKEEQPDHGSNIEISLGAAVAVEKLMTQTVHGSGGFALGLSQPGKGSWFPIEFGISAFGSTEFSSAPNEGVVTRRAATRLSYCPLRIGGRLSLLVCSAGDFGLLFAQGRGLEGEAKATRFTALVGGEGRLRARVTRHGLLWFAPSIHVALTERHFAVEPEKEVLSSTASVGWRISSGIAWVF